jgi:hypothetical protein
MPKYLNLKTHSTTSPRKAIAGRGGALPSAHTHMNLILGTIMVSPTAAFLPPAVARQPSPGL